MRNHTKIAVVLDRSGSMSSVRTDTIGGFNSFLDEQIKQPGTADISFYQFDDQYEVIYEHKELQTAPKLNNETYVPRGYTALLDAIGRSVDSLGAHLSSLPEADRPDKVIFVVITDGHENASREYSAEKIRDMIRLQEQTYSWEFVYLGATLDAVSVAQNLGIKGGSAAFYDSANTQGVFSKMSSKLGTYRGMSKEDREELTSGGAAFFTDEDRKDLANASK
jgi:hypothetical protein